MDPFTATIVTGVVATIVMDAWTLARQRLFGIALPDYGLVGRWCAHVVRGRFRHDSIKATPPVHGERTIGWIVHYAVGIAFAAILPAVWGREWSQHPSLAPALFVGLATVAAPFLVMQPGMGAGVAARRTPDPAAARLQSLVTHAVFGLGLYVGGAVAQFLPAA